MPKLGFLGADYVGIAEAVGWAEQGYSVVLVESSQNRIEELTMGSFFSSEQELVKVLQKVKEQGTLEITWDLSKLADLSYVFLSVPILVNYGRRSNRLPPIFLSKLV